MTAYGAVGGSESGKLERRLSTVQHPMFSGAIRVPAATHEGRTKGTPSRDTPLQSSPPTRADLRVLTITRIFPNQLEPFACAFQRQQIGGLARLCRVEVAAPVPYLFGSALLGARTRAGRLRTLPVHEVLDGIHVIHPRVPYLPWVGHLPVLAPANVPLYLSGLLPHLSSLRGRFDVILGTFLYPDACAAAALAKLLGLPFVIKAHGTDVNVVSRWPSIRPILAATLGAARYSAAVSRPMVQELVRLGAPVERAVYLPNGVDRQVFRPSDKAEARALLDLPAHGIIALYVGRLEKQKGISELFEAFVALNQDNRPTVHVVVVGEGSYEGELRASVAALNGAARRARFVFAGEHPLETVARYLAACDLLVLPSWGEGTPNAVLEALACGRPVVASRVGGIPDVVLDGRNGLLVPPRDVGALVDAIRNALQRPWDEATLVASAPLSWDEVRGSCLACSPTRQRPRPGRKPTSVSRL